MTHSWSQGSITSRTQMMSLKSLSITPQQHLCILIVRISLKPISWTISKTSETFKLLTQITRLLLIWSMALLSYTSWNNLKELSWWSSTQQKRTFWIKLTFRSCWWKGALNVGDKICAPYTIGYIKSRIEFFIMMRKFQLFTIELVTLPKTIV